MSTGPDETFAFPGLDRKVPPLGVGTWAWGDEKTWGMGGYDPALTEATIAEAWRASIDAGVALIDTAEVYGKGESERIIGRLLAATPEDRSRAVLASKFMPSPNKLDVVSAMRSAALASRDRLGVDVIDLYQIHGPISLRSKAALAEALATVHAEGIVAAVGVSNYSIKEMTSIHGELAKRNLALASNQIEFSPLRTSPETSGLLGRCATLGVVVLAYSPLGQGRLGGRYSAKNPPPSSRNFSAHPMERVDRIVDVLRSIGEEHGGRTPAQVALRWIIDKGAVPIPGAKNAMQATGNAGALGWTLTEVDIAAIDAVSLSGVRSLANRFWQHG